VGRDDDPLLLGDSVLDGRHEVGERLADAGARLGGQVVPGAQRVGDGLGHLELLRAVLVPLAEPPGDRAGRAEDVLQGGLHWGGHRSIVRS
jgi:hypothetical protein